MTRFVAVTLLLALAACSTGLPVVAQEDGPQYYQAPGFPHNSFYCP